MSKDQKTEKKFTLAFLQAIPKPAKKTTENKNPKPKETLAYKCDQKDLNKLHTSIIESFDDGESLKLLYFVSWDQAYHKAPHIKAQFEALFLPENFISDALGVTKKGKYNTKCVDVGATFIVADTLQAWNSLKKNSDLNKEGDLNKSLSMQCEKLFKFRLEGKLDKVGKNNKDGTPEIMSECFRQANLCEEENKKDKDSWEKRIKIAGIDEENIHVNIEPTRYWDYFIDVIKAKEDGIKTFHELTNKLEKHFRNGWDDRESLENLEKLVTVFDLCYLFEEIVLTYWIIIPELIKDMPDKKSKEICERVFSLYPAPMKKVFSLGRKLLKDDIEKLCGTIDFRDLHMHKDNSDDKKNQKKIKTTFRNKLFSNDERKIKMMGLIEEYRCEIKALTDQNLKITTKNKILNIESTHLESQFNERDNYYHSVINEFERSLDIHQTLDNKNDTIHNIQSKYEKIMRKHRESKDENSSLIGFIKKLTDLNQKYTTLKTDNAELLSTNSRLSNKNMRKKKILQFRNKRLEMLERESSEKDKIISTISATTQSSLKNQAQKIECLEDQLLQKTQQEQNLREIQERKIKYLEEQLLQKTQQVKVLRSKLSESYTENKWLQDMPKKYRNALDYLRGLIPLTPNILSSKLKSDTRIKGDLKWKKPTVKENITACALAYLTLKCIKKDKIPKSKGAQGNMHNEMHPFYNMIENSNGHDDCDYLIKTCIFLCEHMRTPEKNWASFEYCLHYIIERLVDSDRQILQKACKRLASNHFPGSSSYVQFHNQLGPPIQEVSPLPSHSNLQTDEIPIITLNINSTNNTAQSSHTQAHKEESSTLLNN